MDGIMEILWEVLINGVIIVAGGTLLVTFVCANYFKKASTGTAFVRTGAAGTLVVCDGGAMVLPLYQEVSQVGLGCHRISVFRSGRDSFTDSQGNSIEVEAHAFIRVQPEIGGILSAARTLGASTLDSDSMSRLMAPRVASVVRECLAARKWSEMMLSQDEVAAEIREKTQEAIGCNGLVLDYLAISTLRKAEKARDAGTNEETPWELREETADQEPALVLASRGRKRAAGSR